MDWTAVTAIAAAIVAAVGLLGWLFKTPGSLIADQRAQIQNLRSDHQAAILEVATLQLKLRECNVHSEELEELRKIAGRLSLAAIRGLRVDALADAWDHCHDGIVLSCSGKWLWVNQAMCATLGLSRDEILDTGWEDLVDPLSLKRTRAVEGSQWHDRVLEYVVRYKRAESIGGGWVQLRWHCTAYDDDGNTFCVVWVEDVTTDEQKQKDG